MAALLRNFGDGARAEKLKKEAAELAKRLDKAFWMADGNYYAMALDGNKQQLKCVASNPGHLLFTRAVSRSDPEQSLRGSCGTICLAVGDGAHSRRRSPRSTL